MTAPQNKIQDPLPPEGEIPETYPDLINELECTCAAGAIIKSIPLPSATINLGDIIADQTRILSTFTSVYGLVTVVLRMISCIIDVLCALVNPFSLIFAIIRLFRTCLPDFILIFPQFAIPAKIICIIKIILSIVDYILNVIVPIIEEIIANIQNLIDAFAKNNTDAQAAIAFKIVALFKEIFNIIGILTALLPLWEMVKALLKLGIAIPCGGGGGSCVGCGDDQCPEAIQQYSITGNDGVMTVTYGENIFDFLLYFYSASNRSQFISIKDFFPRGLDYYEIKDEDDLPYTLTVDGNTYAVTGINSEGTMNLFQLIPDFSTDGYLSLTTGSGLPLPDPTKDIRLGTPTGTFSSFLTNKYATLSDIDGPTNSGTWRIVHVYDAYNMVLRREDESPWATSSKVYWRIAPHVPSTGSGKSYSFDINHNELIRYNLINLGCHPSVKAEKDALATRFPDAANFGDGLGLPTLPEISGVINVVTSCVTNVVPFDVDSQYILNNYATIATEVTDMGACIESGLYSFKSAMVTYGKEIYPRLFNPETTANTFTASPLIQVVGSYSNISLTAYDIYGEILGKGFPEDVVEAQIFASGGQLSAVSPVIDAYGMNTGTYTATITSDLPTTITLTAKIAGKDVSDFDGETLVAKKVYVEFVALSDMKRRSSAVAGEVSTEPLGAVRSE